MDKSDKLDIIDINQGLVLKLFRNKFTRPIELEHCTENLTMKFELTIQEAIRLVAVLSQYVEDNNGN